MKGLNLHGVGDLRYDDLPIPVPQSDEVLLKIKAVGICGSDIPRVFVSGTYHFPTIIGHEFAGVVAETAPEDAKLKGKRASVFPLIPCHKCAACREGNFAQCVSYDYYGSRRDGAMAEYLAVKKENLCFLPDAVTYEEAAMNEPAAVAIHAFRRSGAQKGDTILIYGVGTVALLLAQWAKAQGVKNIILAARSDEKCAFAKNLGFPLTINVERDDLDKLVMEVTAGRGVEVAFEGTGQSLPWEKCLALTQSFGTVVSLGNPVGDMSLSQKGYWRIMRQELRLVGTWNSSFGKLENDWRLALQAMSEKKLQPAALITHRFPLAEYTEAFGLMRDKREMFVKVMFCL
ncbi:MAG: galactitol-1-phosphate 5-dehydrogenase [Selenomonadaceae bacterium]|nr:galactitol-1-phosphate 5-dehydrogenase [Selenomonadaceae bacterium]